MKNLFLIKDKNAIVAQLGKKIRIPQYQKLIEPEQMEKEGLDVNNFVLPNGELNLFPVSQI